MPQDFTWKGEKMFKKYLAQLNDLMRDMGEGLSK
jgi:hypothetical protein